MSYFLTEYLNFEDLTEDEIKIVPNNGHGKEYATYLKVTHKGKTIMLKSDAMEVEDITFSRDLRWVGFALDLAYKLGKEDSKN